MAYKLGIIGAGKIGEALLQGVLQKGLLASGDIILSVKSEKHRAELEARTGVKTVRDNREVVADKNYGDAEIASKSIDQLHDRSCNNGVER